MESADKEPLTTVNYTRKEIVALLNLLSADDVSRRIIEKAASPHSPVAVNEFEDIRATTMIRHLNLLQCAGILEPIWENNVRKFAITENGRLALEFLKKNP